MRNLHSFFNPRSIAVVGASPKKGKLGNIILENIAQGDWKGKIYCVNPKHKRIGKYKCFANLSGIKKTVDLAIVAIPALVVNEVLEAGVKTRPKISNYAVISAGFKESGSAGKKLEEKLVSIAKKHNLNILGPNCLGFLNSDANLNATFAGVAIIKGRIAIVSQSGALAVELLDWMQSAQIGFSKIVSMGNKAILDESDLIRYLGKDKNTAFITLYLEDIKNGEKFVSAAAKIAAKKPLIALKAGKTAAGQKAVSSHTGSMAQREDIVQAVFEKLNIIEAKDIEEFQDMMEYLNFAEIPNKKKVIVLTNAGGPGVMASDFVGKSSILKMSSIPLRVQEKLRKILPHAAAVKNPIDVLGDAAPERYEKVLQILASDMRGYPVIVILTPQSQSKPAETARILAKYKYALPALAACFMGGKKIQPAEDSFRKNGIANYENSERALAVIEKLVSYKEKEIIPLKAAQSKKYSESDAEIRSALDEKRKMLFWPETEKLFRRYGISLAKSFAFDDHDFSKITLPKKYFPCALKTDDSDIAHRWEKKAVALNIETAKDLIFSFRKMRKSTRAKKFIVQPMLPHGLELIVGMKRDPSFGPIIVAGLGGTYAEALNDRIILVSPFEKGEVKKKLKQLKMYSVLSGFRGDMPYNLAEIEKIALALQSIARKNPRISEIDINPLILYNNGRKYQIADAKLFLKN